MTDVQFDENQDFANPVMTQEQPVLVRFVLSTGFAKTEKGAEYLLLGVAVVFTVIALFLFFSGGSGTSGEQRFKEGQSVFAPPGAI